MFLPTRTDLSECPRLPRNSIQELPVLADHWRGLGCVARHTDEAEQRGEDLAGGVVPEWIMDQKGDASRSAKGCGLRRTPPPPHTPHKCSSNSRVDGAGSGGASLAGGTVEDLAIDHGLLAREAAVEDIKVVDNLEATPCEGGDGGLTGK